MVSRLLMRVESGGTTPREVTAPRVDDGFGANVKRMRKTRHDPKFDDMRPAVAKANGKRPTRGATSDDSKHLPEPGYGAFHVTWGEAQGADARRLLAIVCRKGRIRSQDVGVIRIGNTSSVVEVRAQVAAAFAKAANGPDRRDPLVRIAPLRA
jgi:ATP-dependent RNA helicase DeaD